MQDFNAIKLLLASPDDVLSWSFGEVKTAETINYRSLRAEPGGLMCERIFGPTKDYECYCGKYRKKKYKGIVCDKCGVEVTSSKVRRERMGHIRLSVPVVHVWYSYGVPCKLSILLNIPSKKLISVIYYIRYIVTAIDQAKKEEALKEIEETVKREVEALEGNYAEKLAQADADVEASKKPAKSSKKGVTETNDNSAKNRAILKKEILDQKTDIEKKYESIRKLVEGLSYKSVITEEEYRSLSIVNTKFYETDMGGSAVSKLLADLDLNKLKTQLEAAYNVVKGAQRFQVERRLKLVEGFLKNGIKPEWLVMKVIPVLPADLRPIVALAGGRFATSDINDLYRRVINRNNRLRELMEIGAPDIILRNEKRMLQEAFDALVDNQHRFNKPVLNRTGIPYKSLTESLRGKKGRFRRNLLGKRVDYSGRAVIIPDTNLGVEQVGLPKLLALEIFKPFVVQKLIAQGFAATIKDAKDLIEGYDDRIWDILEEVIKNRTVLLNRPPTLHKYNIQAYYPVLVEGEAVRLNQLVAAGYNADFDGDQMSIFVVLSDEALQETKDSMLARSNLIKVADGATIVGLKMDSVFGLYYLTYMKQPAEDYKYPGFGSIEDVLRMHYLGELKVQDPVKVLINDEVIITTPGRVIFNSLIPEGFGFINETLTKKVANKVLSQIVISFDADSVVEFLDKMKTMAFRYATISGFSLGLSDLVTPKNKAEIIAEAKQKELEIQTQFEMGMISDAEKGRLVIELWQGVSAVLVDEVWNSLTEDNPLKAQVISGANGDKSQAGQIMAMKGVVRDPLGNWVRFPIVGNYADGLNSYEYFVSARGSRKGAIDTALKTAQSGYMTRKLTDVAQDVIVRIDDCGYDGPGHVISRSDIRELNFENRMIGRVVTQDVVNPTTNEVIVAKGEDISPALAKKIDQAGVTEIFVRSTMLCKSPVGVCAACYGYDFGNYKRVELGKAVGVLAAQSISEPMTQMTLRTFHSGGVSSDITSGIPRIVELVEAREPKRSALLAPIDGKVSLTEGKISIRGEKSQRKLYITTADYTVDVKDEQEVSKGEQLFTMKEGVVIKAPFDGKISLTGRGLQVIGTAKAIESMDVPATADLLVADGETVTKGQQLTSGSVDPKVISTHRSLYEAQKYVLDESQKVFLDYGIAIKDVHIEIITRQMTKLAKVIEPGDTNLVKGTFTNRFLADSLNERLRAEQKNEILYQTGLLGVTFISLNAESILAAMSFQEQVKVLSEAAIVGRTDFLRGLKENVIIGRLIPVGKRAIISELDNLEELQTNAND